MKRTKDWFIFGIGVWTGAGVYSIVNLIMNLRHAPNIVTYNYLITGVAVVGLILNMILLKKADQDKG